MAAEGARHSRATNRAPGRTIVSPKAASDSKRLSVPLTTACQAGGEQQQPDQACNQTGAGQQHATSRRENHAVFRPEGPAGSFDHTSRWAFHQLPADPRSAVLQSRSNAATSLRSRTGAPFNCRLRLPWQAPRTSVNQALAAARAPRVPTVQCFPPALRCTPQSSLRLRHVHGTEQADRDTEYPQECRTGQRPARAPCGTLGRPDTADRRTRWNVR